MKKLIFLHLPALLLLAANTFIHSMNSSAALYLENNYGATLNYRTSAFDTKGERIGNNVRLFIGDIDYIPELSIRATGKGSQWVSYYHDLKPMLEEIKKFKDSHPNNDAIISVRPSRIGWDISYAWEPKNKSIKAFEYEDFPSKPITSENISSQPTTRVTPIIEQPLQPTISTKPLSLPTEEIKTTKETIIIQPTEDTKQQEQDIMKLRNGAERLQAIKNGALGKEYAQKATEICAANYTQAEKLGKVNLCHHLQQNLVSPQYLMHGKATIKKRPILRPTIEEIKETINTLHRSLARYRMRGEAF